MKKQIILFLSVACFSSAWGMEQDLNLQMVFAAQNGDISMVQELLDQGVSVNAYATDELGDSYALMQAAGNGRIEIVRLLLDHKADANVSDNRGFTSLMAAAEVGDLQIVDLLIQHGAAINTQAARLHMVSALRQAAQNGRYEVVKYLIENGAIIDLKDQEGYTPLLIASGSGHARVVELLLRHGADVNVQAREMQNVSPLRQAAQNGHLNIVKALLQYNADINIQDDRGITPLMIAAETGHFAVVMLLLEHHALINVQAEGYNNTFALLGAAANDNNQRVVPEKIVQLLLKYGANPRLTTTQGATVLMASAERNNRTMCEKILTTISDSEAEAIRNSFFEGLLAIQRKRLFKTAAGWQVGQSEEPSAENIDALKRVRYLIAQQVINVYVSDFMKRALFLMNQRDNVGRSASDFAGLANHDELQTFLNANNEESRNAIREMIEFNIKRILFERKQDPHTRELSEEEAFGGWLRD